MRHVRLSILKPIFFLLIFIFLSGVEASSKSFSEEDLKQSVEVDFDDLEFSTEGIFLHHFGRLDKVECLFEDENGQYKARLKSFAKDDWSKNWVCPKCNYVNDIWDFKCKRCGYRG